MINFNRFKKAIAALGSESQNDDIQEFISQVVLGSLGVTFVIISIISRGTAQMKLATMKAIRKAPPSLAATTRGKRCTPPGSRRTPASAPAR